MPLHVSSTVVLIIRRSKLYYTASGIITPVGGRPLHRLREDWSQSSLNTLQNFRFEIQIFFLIWRIFLSLYILKLWPTYSFYNFMVLSYSYL